MMVSATASGAEVVASGRSLWAMTTWSKPLPAIVARPVSTAPLSPMPGLHSTSAPCSSAHVGDLVVVARDERRQLAGGGDDPPGQPAGQLGPGEAVEDHRAAGPWPR